MGPSDEARGRDDAEDSGDELEAEIERADHAFGSESFGTTAEEQREGESLDRRLAEEGPSRESVDEALVIEDEDRPDEEAEMLGTASLEHDPFTAPEESTVTERAAAPGTLDRASDPKDREPSDESPHRD